MIKFFTTAVLACSVIAGAASMAQAGEHCERSILQAQNDQIDDTSNVITPNISSRELAASRSERLSSDEAACLRGVQLEAPAGSF